jgi:hypothetical protein
MFHLKIYTGHTHYMRINNLLGNTTIVVTTIYRHISLYENHYVISQQNISTIAHNSASETFVGCHKFSQVITWSSTPDCLDHTQLAITDGKFVWVGDAGTTDSRRPQKHRLGGTGTE